MSVTALVGAQWGSESKGNVAAAIAPWFRAAVRTGGSNAGHTFVHRGVKHVARGIPVAGWVNSYCDLILGAGAIIDRDLLAEEAKSLPPDRLIYIDRNAAIVPPGAHEAEAGMVSTIGSTAEGVGYTRIKKIERNPDLPLLAKDQALWRHPFRVADTVRLLAEHLAMGNEIMLEGTQGAHLSLHHGDWPFVTSNDTNASQLAADAGIAPSHVEHVILVARSYPIRVGGNSGPMGAEVDWSEIPGRPEPEKTTVTKRVRRIAQWDDEIFARSVILNNPCGVVLSFADYLDPELEGETDPALIMQSEPVARLIGGIYADHKVPVIAAGTGGPGFALSEIGPCSHGRRWLRQEHSK